MLSSFSYVQSQNSFDMKLTASVRMCIIELDNFCQSEEG